VPIPSSGAFAAPSSTIGQLNALVEERNADSEPEQAEIFDAVGAR
jgi:hypothetical protein